MTEREAIKILTDFGLQVVAKADGAYQSAIGKMACDMAIQALEEIQQYREMERKLESVYGECEGLLETVVSHLVKHKGVGPDTTVKKTRLLTDEHVDMWEAYKAIGTVEECREAMEKQKTKQSKDGIYGKGYFACGSCKKPLEGDETYCPNCGWKIDWSEEE